MLPDFTAVTAESIAATVETAIAAADATIDALVAEEDPATFSSTLGRLETAGTIIADAAGVGTFMAKVHPVADARTAAVEWEERLTKWSNDLVFRDDVASVIRQYAATDDAAALAGTRRRLLEHGNGTYEGPDTTSRPRTVMSSASCAAG